MAQKKRWAELSTGQQTAVVALASVQLTLAAAAWTDLARRPAAQVRGRKSTWALVIAVNFIGPVAYFARGIQR